MFKLVTTVPEKDADRIREVLAEVGAGKLGNYTHCSFSSKGIGRFKGNENSNPQVGSKLNLEEVVEERIEVNVTDDALKHIVEVLRKEHPYEEPMIDVYKLFTLE